MRRFIESFESRLMFASVPTGFVDQTFASGLSNGTAMEFSPDGRLFVAQQTGALRIIKNGSLLSTPFVTVTTTSSGERGLLGIAFDPNFATNGYVYVYHTVPTAPIHNRVVRYTADPNNPDVALAGSATTILDLPNLSSATNHNGGAIHFGPDGKLYVAVGENANGANSQSFNTRLGKMLRINSDGSIPTDNPYYNSATGDNRAIWGLGLRNPFTFAFDPSGGTMYINDVGENTWEEINVGVSGSNYGWNLIEGKITTQTPPANYRDPLFAYPHSGGPATEIGNVIAGGSFYRRASTATVPFPTSYNGDYFYADSGSGWIRRLDAGTANSSLFATGLSAPVDLKVGPDGALYYLERGNTGRVGRVANVVNAPSTPDLTSLSDSGVSDSDNVTNVATPTFTGSAPAGSTVQIFADGVLVGTGASSGGGTFAITTSALLDGTHSVTAVATSGANPSGESLPLSVLIDTAAPTFKNSSFNYDAASQNLQLTFNDDITGSVQNTDLVLQNLTTNQTIDPANIAAAVLPATTAVFTFDGFASGILPDGNYTATIPAGAVTDRAGNPLADDATADFFVLAGDANHDRAVNIVDLGTLATNWQSSSRSFSQGDFNYDGTVNIVDLGILAGNWQSSLAEPAAPLAANNAVGHSSAAPAAPIFAARKRLIDLVESPADQLV